MARRSPMNERYQKTTAPAGKTRKSAAAAKPKRAVTESRPAKKKPATRARNPMLVNPPTPEYRRWRNIWWALLLSSLASTMVSLALRRWTDQLQLATFLLVAGYVLIFVALYVDWVIIRRLRKEWVEKSDHTEKGSE